MTREKITSKILAELASTMEYVAGLLDDTSKGDFVGALEKSYEVYGGAFNGYRNSKSVEKRTRLRKRLKIVSGIVDDLQVKVDREARK